MAGGTHFYALRNLPGHLYHADHQDRLRELLGSYSFLETKIRNLPPSDLVADYDYLTELSALRRVQSAMRLSAYILERDPAQLPGHLCGRLLDHAEEGEIAGLLAEAQARPSQGLIPITASLTRIGGPLLQTFGIHDGISGVVLSLDGTRVVTSGSDRTIRVWSLATGRELRILRGHEKYVTALILLPDGRRAVSGSLDRTLRIWDLETGEQEGVILTGSEVQKLAVSPDGQRIFVGLQDGAIEILGLMTGERRRLTAHSAGIQTLAITPDGQRLISGSHDASLRIWDLASGTTQKLEEDGLPVWSAVVTPDGNRMLAGSRNGKIGIWSLKDGRRITNLEGHESVPHKLVLMPDGRTLVSASSDGTIRIWNLAELRELGVLRAVTSGVLAVTPDVRRVLVGANSRLTLWDLTFAKREEVLPPPTDDVNALALVPGGSLLVSASSDRKLRIWDTTSGRKVRELIGHSRGIRTAAATPDGRYAVSGSDDRTLKVWNIQTGEVVRTLTGHNSLVMAISLTANGKLVISGELYLNIIVWSLEDGKVIRSWNRPNSYLITFTTTEDGRLAFVSFHEDGDEWPVILDLETGRVVGELRGHEDPVQTILIIPGTDRILTGSYDATIRMWDLATLQELHRFEGHTSCIMSLAVTPDGRYLVSGSEDNMVRVWRLATGECLATFTGEGSIAACAISADTRLVVAGGGSGLHFLRTKGFEPGPDHTSRYSRRST